MKDKQYEREVLIPMHTRFVEAQREAADLVIEVSDKTADEVELMILEFIQKDVFTGSTR
jgi:uridine kinase